MSCKCQYCLEMDKFFAICGRISNEDDKKWLAGFYEMVDGERVDAAVNKAILDGKWPGSVRYLTEALERAKKTDIDYIDSIKWSNNR